MVASSGVAVVSKQASGNPSIPVIEASGTAVANTTDTASGNPSITPIQAAGIASIRNVASGGATLTAITASGIAIVAGVVVVSTIELTGYVIDSAFVGYDLSRFTMTGFLLDED